MPLKGFIHPITRQKVGFDHFDEDRSVNGRSAASPWMARYAGIGVANDVRHAGLDLTATRMLGCPRQTYLEVCMDYWVDPKKLELRTRGSGLHEVAGESNGWNPDVFYTEGADPARMTIMGEIAGYKYSMLCDVLRKDLTEIIDMKFPMDFSISRRGNKAKGDHAVQLNLARLGLAQTEWAIKEGYDPDKVLLTIWDHAIGKNDASKGLPCDHMSVEKMLAHRPGGGEYCVEEILAVHHYAQEAHNSAPGNETLEVRERVAASLPLVGRSQFNSYKCPQYCDVEPLCSRLVREHGEPDVTFDDNDAGDGVSSPGCS